MRPFIWTLGSGVVLSVTAIILPTSSDSGFLISVPPFLTFWSELHWTEHFPFATHITRTKACLRALVRSQREVLFRWGKPVCAHTDMELGLGWFPTKHGINTLDSSVHVSSPIKKECISAIRKWLAFNSFNKGNYCLVKPRSRITTF